MVAVIAWSYFGAQENKICHLFPLFPLLFAIKWWDWMIDLSFFNFEFQANFFTPFSPSSWGFCSSSWLSAIKVLEYFSPFGLCTVVIVAFYFYML